MRSKNELTLRTIEDFEKAEERALLAAESLENSARLACARGDQRERSHWDMLREAMISRAHTAAVGRMLAKHLNGQQF